jgi:hypothetical protein
VATILKGAAPTRSLRDRVAAALAVVSVIMMAGGLLLATSSTATAVDDTNPPCGTPGSAAYDETVVDVPAKAAYDEVVHHAAVPAVTRLVHHDAVTETVPDQRYSWNPQGPNDESAGTPGWPEPATGKWTANSSTYRAGDPLGTVFQSGGGNGGDNASWFYWTVKQVETSAAYDETVVDVPAKAAYDETVHHVAVPAVTRVVHHAAVPAGPCLVAPGQATVNPPTCLAAGSVTDPAEQAHVDVTRTVLPGGSVRFVSTPAAGYHFAGDDQPVEQVVKALPRKSGAACGEIEGEEGNGPGEKPNPKPSVKPDVAGVGGVAGIAGTGAGIAGTEAGVPSAVDAGLVGDAVSGPSTLQLVGRLLTGVGLLVLVAAGWSGAGRRTRAAARG